MACGTNPAGHCVLSRAINPTISLLNRETLSASFSFGKSILNMKTIGSISVAGFLSVAVGVWGFILAVIGVVGFFTSKDKQVQELLPESREITKQEGPQDRHTRNRRSCYNDRDMQNNP